jgi:hypothetical protein
MMERLTDKSWRNLDPWECCGQDQYCKRGCHEKGGCTNGCIVPKLYEKLAKYEDLEKQGLLKKLPCKIGDIVYVNYPIVCDLYAAECEVTRIWKDRFSDSIEFRLEPIEQRSEYLRAYECEFGKSIFFTKSEAEQALAKMGGEIDGEID